MNPMYQAEESTAEYVKKAGRYPFSWRADSILLHPKSADQELDGPAYRGRWQGDRGDVQRADADGKSCRGSPAPEIVRIPGGLFLNLISKPHCLCSSFPLVPSFHLPFSVYTPRIPTLCSSPNSRFSLHIHTGPSGIARWDTSLSVRVDGMRRTLFGTKRHSRPRTAGIAGTRPERAATFQGFHGAVLCVGPRKRIRR
jgi:hypothetical protein